MKVATVEVSAASGLTVAAIGTVIWASGPVGYPWLAVSSATVSLVTAAGLLFWLSPGGEGGRSRLRAWLLGLGAALVVGLGSAADYGLWFADSRLWTAACHVAALALVAWAGTRGGWTAGLRSALVAHLGASGALLIVLRWNWGTAEQTAVFQAAGVLDAYAAAGGTDFQQWVAGAYLGAVLPRTMAAVVLGAALGAVTGWASLRKRNLKARPLP